MRKKLAHIFGGAFAVLRRGPGSGITDVLLLLGILGGIFGIFSFSRSASAPLPPGHPIEIDLSPWSLPLYTFYSLLRGLIAFALSLIFTLVYGYWAAKDKIAQRVLVPLLDILQSIPVLGFLPIVLVVFVNLFPGRTLGIELAVIFMIFTGQAWNMTFSFFHSLNSIPSEQREAAAVYRFTWWERFKWVELPFSMMGLVWNSMMSLAGGWFFLMACEAFSADETRSFRVPGIGSYMSMAYKAKDWPAVFYAILAMILMIVFLDQIVCRPVVVWAQKFRIEEGGASETEESWFLDFIRRSDLVAYFRRLARLKRFQKEAAASASSTTIKRPVQIKMQDLPDINKPSIVGWALSTLVFYGLLALMLWGAYQIFLMLRQVQFAEWLDIVEKGGATLLRVLGATVLGTLWALPAGLAIGLSPKLSRVLQPVVQVVASFPAPMLYGIVIFVLTLVGISLNVGSMALMLLGTQWYILFNVIAGAMAIPADLKEMARSFGVKGWQRFWVLYVPACFPYLVTGWVTAAGGAWNASIIAEYIDDTPPKVAFGLGSDITMSATAGNWAHLAASVVIMSTIVVLFNRLVWRRCYDLAETRFSLSK